jgi:hypothetical protein
MTYEAFVYCWTDTANQKLYVGSHKGKIDDGYICSSKIMKEEYVKRPNDFVRQIVATGKLIDIRKLESKILQSVNARTDSNFYNKHENDGFYFDGWKKGEMSLEHRKKLSDAASRRIRTDDHIEKLHEGRKNSKNSAEHKAALIASRVGSKHTEESKNKMSEARRNNPNNVEIAKLAGKISAEKRKNDPTYKSLQSERAKAAWAKRKGGLVHGD